MTTETQTPGERALTMMVELAGELASTADKQEGWREFASLLSADGTLDGLDWNDARHTAAVIMVDLHHDGPDALRGRADFLQGGGPEVAVSAASIHDLPAVINVLRRVADVADQPG